MYYFTLYSNGMAELQRNRDVYATFNSLYLVSSNILLTHTHTHTHTHRRTAAKFLYKYFNVRARGARAKPYRHRISQRNSVSDIVIYLRKIKGENNNE